MHKFSEFISLVGEACTGSLWVYLPCRRRPDIGSPTSGPRGCNSRVSPAHHGNLFVSFNTSFLFFIWKDSASKPGIENGLIAEYFISVLLHSSQHTLNNITLRTTVQYQVLHYEQNYLMKNITVWTTLPYEHHYYTLSNITVWTTLNYEHYIINTWYEDHCLVIYIAHCLLAYITHYSETLLYEFMLKEIDCCMKRMTLWKTLLCETHCLILTLLLLGVAYMS